MRVKQLLHFHLPALRSVLWKIGESLERAHRRVRRIHVSFIEGGSCYLVLIDRRFIIEIGRKLRGRVRHQAVLHEMAHWVCEFYFETLDHGERWCEIVTLLGCPEEATKYGGTPALPDSIAARNCS